MKNYKVLKAAAKLTLEKVDDTKYKITRKMYDPETGEALDDKVTIAYVEFIDGIISGLTEHIEASIYEKEDWVQLKEDLDGLG